MEQRVLKRSEVPEEMTWRLEDIYEDTAAWKADEQAAYDYARKLAQKEGIAASSATELLEAMKLYEECAKKAYKIHAYALMRSDQDTGDTEGQNLKKMAQSAYTRLNEIIAFFWPELLKLDEEKLNQYIEEVPELEEYRIGIEDTLRQREHMLSKEMEQLLASAGEMASTASNAFGMLNNADIRFPDVLDVEGNNVALSKGRFVALETSDDRDLRKNAFEAFYTRYKDFANTWASLYEGQVKKLIFFARARHYESTLVAAVEGSNNVSRTVYENLIESVHENMDKMHRYVRLRKKLLDVEELHMYDVYKPMVGKYSKTVTYEEAKAMTLEALKPLGEEYLDLVKTAYANRWIDVLENEGKRGGAYSEGVYGVHPYMLLNFNETFDDVFTLIHEMGHSMHTWYSDHAQNFFNGDYKIFVAEVASTTNEVLLLEYLLGKAETKQEKAYLINHYLESFKGTLYRQTMFAEFERESNRMAEEGTPLTAESLCKLYYDLNKEYFGPDMVSDPLIAYEWCRIPHFYYNFYVYQYATSFAAAVSIAHKILAEGEPMVEKYLTFLKSGCTKDPVSLLKIAGVDLSTKEPIDAALKVFDEAIDRMEALML